MPTATTAASGDSATRNAYGAVWVTPSNARITQAMMRTTPSLPMMTAYELKRPDPEQMPRATWAGAYATKPVASAEQQPPIAVEVGPVISALNPRIAISTRMTIAIARRTMRPTTGWPPWCSARRCDSARPSSCSSGRKKPGASANVANHRLEIGWNSASPPSAILPILKNAYVAKPATSRAMPTGHGALRQRCAARRGCGRRGHESHETTRERCKPSGRHAPSLPGCLRATGDSLAGS